MLKSLDLSGRVAVVVGGTSGLGRVIAVGLAEGGADVIPTGRRAELVREVAAEVEKLGRRTLAEPCDVGERASIDRLRDRALEAFGHIDVLINAAGRIARKPTRDLPENEWTEIMNTNVTGCLRTCQSFYGPLAANGRGRIVNICSLNSYVALKEVAAYAASKSALLSMTRSLAVEWSPAGINVNGIAPGVFRTDLNKGLLDGTDRGRELLLRTPIKRFGKLEEVVGAAVFLSSDAASFVTGECIVVDGGFLASGVNS